MAMAPVLDRTLRRRPEDLFRLAAEVQTFLDRAGVDPAVRFKVELALEEAVRNLQLHAVRPRSDRIQVRVDAGPDRIELQLEDDGEPFDPRSGPAFDPARPLAERETGGMGLYLLRQLLDEIHYQPLAEGNRLRLVVRTTAPMAARTLDEPTE
jgi:serine/threonine-protein kinase RsbW